ncbi:epoxide hydrolase 4-like [Styela clava]|uniref:epoxide hydrolase 4-like n=1 Tax=Styela clava TaxID=7725 RepID=UPI0019393EB3|nr:epoxide hydrolase 4-like [Styela clava]
MLETIRIFVIKSVSAAIILSIGSFWSVVVLFGVLRSVITEGPSKVFCRKNRHKESPPFHYIAWDEKTRNNPGPNTKSWNHANITVPESGMRFHYVYSGKKPKHITISDIDGETVNIHDDEDNEPKLILCLHGFPENWFSWRHMLRYFDNPSSDLKNHFVVAVDLRGYGDTDKPKSTKAYHINLLVSDVRGIAQALGYNKFVLMGHDWGGAISFRVASIYPEILEKCIIMNAVYTPVFSKNRSFGQFLKSWYMFFYQLPILPEWTFYSSDYKFMHQIFEGEKEGISNEQNRMTNEEFEVFKYSLSHSMNGPINYYRAAIWPFNQPGPPLLYPRIKSVGKPLHSVPILLIWGDRDAFLSKELAAKSGEYFNTNNGSKVVYVRGSSHWVQQDSPQEIIKHVVDFLK